MSSLHIVCFTGNFGKLQFRPAGTKTNSGKTLQFPTLSLPVTIPSDQFTINGKLVTLADQKFWLDIGVPTNKNKQPEIAAIESLGNKIANGHSYGLVIGALINEWGNPPKRSVKVPFSGVGVSNRPTQNLNRVDLFGRVVEQQPNYLQIEERYNVKGEWRSRYVPVVVTGPLDRLVDRNVLVYGRLATKTYTGESDIYVVANETEVFAV